MKEGFSQLSSAKCICRLWKLAWVEHRLKVLNPFHFKCFSQQACELRVSFLAPVIKLRTRDVSGLLGSMQQIGGWRVAGPSSRAPCALLHPNSSIADQATDVWTTLQQSEEGFLADLGLPWVLELHKQFSIMEVKSLAAIQWFCITTVSLMLLNKILMKSVSKRKK